MYGETNLHPPDAGVPRGERSRLPTLIDQHPAWIQDQFVSREYPDRLADNATYWDEQASRAEQWRDVNDALSDHNYFYKQEKPNDRPNAKRAETLDAS